MIIKAADPVGIDIIIQRFQKDLHDHLIDLWGLDQASAKDYLCHDRCYRNQNTDGYLPELYTTKGEYKELMVDDKVKALSFFGIGGNIDYDRENQQNIAQVHLIFFVDLKKLKATEARPDEEVRRDVELHLRAGYMGMNLTGVLIGIDNVFAEYNGWIKDRGIKYRDLQPFHCFRFNFELAYDPAICSC